MKAGKVDEKVADYVLVEDVQNSWEKREQERSSSQRILNMSEKVLQAQNKWKGAGTFVLRKVSTVSLSSVNDKYFSNIKFADDIALHITETSPYKSFFSFATNIK